MITIRKITPSLAAVMRRGWQSNVAFFPLARLAALLFTAGLWLIQPAKARRTASTRKGGTWPRTLDEMPARLAHAWDWLIPARYGRPSLRYRRDAAVIRESGRRVNRRRNPLPSDASGC
jgi:hypothetical protein